MIFIPGNAPILKQGQKVIVEVPVYGEVKGKIVGEGSADRQINPTYLVECTDETFPDNVYDYSTFVYPLTLIELDNSED